MNKIRKINDESGSKNRKRTLNELYYVVGGSKMVCGDVHKMK